MELFPAIAISVQAPNGIVGFSLKEKLVDQHNGICLALLQPAQELFLWIGHPSETGLVHIVTML